MSVLLALDIATKTGFARGPIDGHRVVDPLEAAAGVSVPQPEGGIRKFSGALGSALAQFADWLWKMSQGVDLIAYECPILPATTNITTIRRLNGMAGMAAMVAHKRGLPEPFTPQPGAIKKHWAATGRAKKPDMIAACIARGWRAEDDNHADALALWDLTVARLRAKMWIPKTPPVRRKGAA